MLLQKKMLNLSIHILQFKDQTAKLEEGSKKLKQSNKNILFVNEKVIEENAKLKDRIAELDKIYDRQVRIINDLNIEVVKEQEKLKQFTERLKEKAVDYYTKGIIDETLKEFLNGKV